MGGTIHFYSGKEPPIGSKVMIVVDDVNAPTGIWQGVLTSIGGTSHETSRPNNCWANCVAEIVNPRFSSNITPRVNYDVYLASAGTDYLIQKFTELKIKLEKTQNRSQIEKEMSVAFFKSAVSPDFADEFKKIMKELLGR